jgi:hypothetical protein
MKTIEYLHFRIAMLAVLIIICVAAASPVWTEMIYPTNNTDELKSLFNKKQTYGLCKTYTKKKTHI